MALTIGQMAAASYEAVLNEMRKPTNQWADNTLLDIMDKMGMIDHVSFGPTLEITLDYRRNPGGDFLATDLTPLSLVKTEVLTAASYVPAQLSIPVTWSKGDDMMNPTENQKVPIVKSLLTNGFETHDDMIEEAIFQTSTDGFLGMLTIVPDSGQGTVGGISAATEVWWRNHSDTYAADGSDIEAVLTEAWNTAAKGSGSKMKPELLFSGADAHALFESTQTPQMRYDDQNIKAGAKSLMFKTAKYEFSQYGDDHIYGVSRKSFSLKVSKQYFREKGEQQALQGQEGWYFSIYSGLQLVTGAKSRLFVVREA